MTVTNEQEQVVCDFLRKLCPSRDWAYLGEVEHLWIAEMVGAITATVGAGTCSRVYNPNRITKKCTCSNCGYGASDERWAYCPKCGHKYVHGEVEEMWKSVGRKVAE